MMKLMTLLLLPVLFFVDGWAVNPAAPSSVLVDYLSMANGVFSTGQTGNCEQIRQPNNGNGVIVTFRPWDVPVLYPAWAIYYLLERNGTRLGEQIFAVTEQAGGSIRVERYNVLNTPPRVQGEFGVEHLMNLTLNDLASRADCDAVLTQQGPNEFGGPWPFCRGPPSSNTPAYQSTLKCNSWDLQGLVPNLAYKRVPSCGRFPLLPYMQGGSQTFQGSCNGA